VPNALLTFHNRPTGSTKLRYQPSLSFVWKPRCFRNERSAPSSDQSADLVGAVVDSVGGGTMIRHIEATLGATQLGSRRFGGARDRFSQNGSDGHDLTGIFHHIVFSYLILQEVSVV